MLLGVVTNATGWLTASNEIVFSNCFAGIKASIRLRNTRSGLEHFVILHESPADPASLGLSAGARVEMLTEQLAGETPSARTRIIQRETDPAKRAAMLEPDFNDTELLFGAMKMGSGNAFGTGTRTNSETSFARYPVGKSYQTIANRRILIEAVEHRRALPALKLLPVTTNTLSWPDAALDAASDRKTAQRARKLPTLAARIDNGGTPASIRAVAALANDRTDALLAGSKTVEAPAFVIDWHVTLNGYIETDLIFRGDTTYLVNEPTVLAGTITIEGGTVVKFSQYAFLTVDANASLMCDTTNHLPAVFTCYDDNSVGASLPGSTGIPSQYESCAFYFYSGAWEFRNVRFTHLGYPFYSEGGAITLRNVQVLDAAIVFQTGPVLLKVFNGLFKDCAYLYEGGEPTFLGEHLTIHNATRLGYSWSPSTTSLTLKNSLLFGIQNPSDNVGPYDDSGTASPSTSPFATTVEGGSHYLPASSPHLDAGGTDIDPELRNSLTEMTVLAPEMLTGNQTTDRILSRRSIRDTNALTAPDRGYHYPAIDYVAKDFTIQNCTVTLQGGVALGAAFSATYGSALSLGSGKLNSIGTPTRMNQVLRLNQVQENPVVRGLAAFGGGGGIPKPEITLRFTEMSALADEQNHMYLVNVFGPIELCHNSFFNGAVYSHLYGGSVQVVGLTNNLWRSVAATFHGLSPAYLHLYNNTFIDGSFTFDGGNSTWRIYDNVFDKTKRYYDSSAIGSSNIYAGTASGDQTPLPTDIAYVPVNSLSYSTGALGRFYAPSLLADIGSRNADAAGLYHFTTSTNQVKELASRVDAGFHCVALNTGNEFVDADADELGDYLEDTTANGLFDSGDLSDYRNKDSDGDGLEDNYEFTTTQTSPVLANTTGTGANDAYKDSDRIGSTSTPDGLFNQEEMQLGTDPLVPNVAQPLFSPLGGSYDEEKNVTITSPTTGATIRYTTDGSEPTTSSPIYSSPIYMDDYITLKAKAWKTGWTPSDTENETYLIWGDNESPTLSILPETGLTFAGSDSIEILVQAEDSDGTVAKVQLFRGDYKVAEAAGGVLRFSLHSVPSGTYAFTARAIDNEGAVTVSSSVSITIASAGPVVSLYGAQPFFTSSPGALIASITGVNPGSLTSVTLNGNAVPMRAGEFMLFPALSAGENTFTLLVNGTVSATTKVYLDTVAPTITITSPWDYDYFEVDRVNVTGTYTESNLKRITVNGVLAFTGSGTFEARNVPLAYGYNGIIAIAEDIAGNTATNTISLSGGVANPSDPVQLTVSPVAGLFP